MLWAALIATYTWLCETMGFTPCWYYPANISQRVFLRLKKGNVSFQKRPIAGSPAHHAHRQRDDNIGDRVWRKSEKVAFGFLEISRPLRKESNCTTRSGPCAWDN